MFLPLNGSNTTLPVVPEPIIGGPSSFLESLASLLGALSLGCWVVLLIPQLLETYKYQSGESISELFLIIWLIGDAFNVIGSIWGNVASTVLVLSVYYCFSDSMLLLQVYYYRYKARKNGTRTGEQQPLLESRTTASGHAPMAPYEERVIFWDTWTETQRGVFMIGIVCVSTFIGNWVISKASVDNSNNDVSIWPSMFGVISSVLYFVARFPQIIKNHRNKSTKGLSIFFFILSMSGNITYVLSIIAFPAADYCNYLKENSPWLIGAASTVFLDVIIFFQFIKYRSE
ncbi:G-protein coupled receptor Stm1 [Schizosaccharomyces japonicus yFS275]|uniref:G-protein coupled receptor Stm1 n=1 Tax=Schizosaccharomyces japonicus (strain yFS275 / FY16936) TaxID=402676 RepID=B6JUS6_SCHJY|nr:G-protein coupled receptor Stm1 [Schizosaccharomyces japonicus yFS275]EEB05059.1 G-protein coupled receptor Stm1 [Schizosaccharomyces japonicus yFS275]